MTNTGDWDGDEVVQCYVRHRRPPVVWPAQQLKEFRRIRLARREIQTVIIPLAVADLAYYDESQGRWQVAPGDYEIQVGASSADIRLRAIFRVVP